MMASAFISGSLFVVDTNLFCIVSLPIAGLVVYYITNWEGYLRNGEWKYRRMMEVESESEEDSSDSDT